MKQILMVLMSCLGLGFFPNPGAAQVPEIIISAGRLLEQGQIDACIQLLEPLRNTPEVSERFKTLRLLSMAYLIAGKSDSALLSAEQLLTLNPEYRPSAVQDPVDLVYLLNQLLVIPKFSLGLSISAGSNTTFPRVLGQSYTLQAASKSYSNTNSYVFSVKTAYRFNERWSLEGSIMNTTKSYQIEYQSDDWSHQVNERTNHLEFPVLLQRQWLSEGSIQAYAGLGVFYGRLLNASSDFTSVYKPGSERISVAGIDAMPRRKAANWGWVSGLGVARNGTRGTWAFEARWFQSNVNIVNTDSRFQYTQFINDHQYLDDDLCLDNLILSLGYTFNLNYRILTKEDQWD
jgi:hypothetical protein